MCGCKDCKEITMPSGLDGVGIANIASNSFGTVTFTYTNGQTVTLPCSCAQSLVYYRTERLGGGTSGSGSTFNTLTNMTYTIPAGGAGVYGLEFISDAEFNFSGAGANTVTIQIFKNGVEIDVNVQKRISVQNTGSGSANYIIPCMVKIANVSLAVGDVISVRSSSTAPMTAFLNFGVITINRFS